MKKVNSRPFDLDNRKAIVQSNPINFQLYNSI